MDTFGFYVRYYDPALLPNSFDGKSYEQLKSSGDTHISHDFKMLMKCFDSLERRVREYQLIYENGNIEYGNPLERALGIDNPGHARYTILKIFDKLVTEKIRQVDDNNNNDIEYKRIRFVSQSKIVTDIWNYLVYRFEKLCRVMFQRYEKILKEKKSVGLPDDYQFEICFYNILIFCYDDFLKVMNVIRFVFDYFIDSFSKVIVANQLKITGDVMMHSIFFKTLEEIYKGQMDVFVHDFINTRRQCKISEDAPSYMLSTAADNNFWLHLINLPLGIDIEKIFIENIKRHYSKYNVELETLIANHKFSKSSELSDYMDSEMSFGRKIEHLTANTIYQAIWDSVFLKGKLFETMFKESICEPYSFKKRKNFVENYLNMFDFACEVGDLNSIDFIEEERRVIINYLNDSYEKKDKDEFFSSLLKVQGFFVGKEGEELVRTVVNDFLSKNNLTLIDIFMERFEKEVRKMIELIRKYCEGGSNIRKLTGNELKINSDPERPHFSLYLKTQMVEMPRRYGFGPYLPKIMLDFYFRELIRNFQEFSKLLTVKHSLPLKLIQQLSIDYGTSEDMAELNKLHQSVVDLYNVGRPEHNELINDYRSLECDALILQRNKYYDSLSQNDYKDMNLPDELAARWEFVTKDYEEHAKNGTLKNIVPVYQLQRCEVDSPYKIPGSDKQLTLDLTLYQACVLQEFNDRNELSFSELYTLTNLDKNILQAVLKSFVSSNLMIKEGSNVKLNLDYQPNMDKIEYNKIIIPMGKITTGSSDKVHQKSKTGISKKVGNQSVVHKEGLGSYWKQELLKAAIVRMVKASGIKYEEQNLIIDVRNQVNGFSIGEFNTAMAVLLRDKYIFKNDDTYAYNME